MSRFTLVTAFALLCLTAVRADDKSEMLAKQKAAAEENWMKMEFGKAATEVETPSFLILSRQTEAKTKTLAASLEKIFATAMKPLKYNDKERPWPGKLVIYIVPDRNEFVTFMRRVVKKSPTEDDLSFGEVRGDDAMFVIGSPKAGQVDPAEQAKLELTSLLLKRKMGAGSPPTWVAIGFARASAHRAISNTRVPARAPAGVPLSYLWTDGGNPKVVQNYSTYVIDYMAYGPLADSFATFVSALRPGENGMAPSMKEALESIKLNEAALEIYARRWAKLPKARNSPNKPRRK